MPLNNGRDCALPEAKALIGARVGDLVAWKRPAGDCELQILSIRYPGRYPGKRRRRAAPF